MKFNIAQMFGRNRDEPNPVNDLRRERRDADKAAMEALKKVLTAEQQARLPKPEARDDQQGDRRGGGNGGGRARGQRGQGDT